MICLRAKIRKSKLRRSVGPERLGPACAFVLPISKLKDWSRLIRVENTHAAGQSTANTSIAHINVITLYIMRLMCYKELPVKIGKLI